MAVTIFDVAERAKVDSSTVSRVMTGNHRDIRISPRTADRVRRAAQKLGYHPSAAARSLRLRRTKTLCFLMAENQSNIALGLYAWMGMTFIERFAAARGYTLLTASYPAEDAGAFITKIASRVCDGLILGCPVADALKEQCERMEIPCLDIVGQHPGKPVCETAFDLVPARLEAVRYLVGLGHRRLTVVHYAEARQRALFDALQQRAAADPSAAPCELASMEVPLESDAAAAGRTLDAWINTPESQRPSALMAYESILAPLVHGMMLRGLSCPRDLSLVALSTSDYFDYLRPRLTGIYNPDEPLVKTAVDTLVDAIEARRVLTPADSPPPIACQFIVRESCGTFTG